MMPGNAEKTHAAPVVAIVGYDEKFYEHLPFLFPHADAKSWFSGNEAFAKRSAFQNGTLQVAYLILALRAVGLDTGPMTGFDNAKVDAEFFAGTTSSRTSSSTSATATRRSCSRAARVSPSIRSPSSSDRDS